jgi:glycosyltransferase involved in cell wall biosynthesis
VTLKGMLPQAELAQRLGQYDIFAFPTWRREPFGCAPLEAAIAGCVPVLAETCGISEWLVHGVHCLKTQRTPQGFARVFADILSGVIDLEPLGRRAAAVVRRDFHLNAVLPRIERALATAAGRSRTGAGSPAEALRLALLGERLTQVLIQEMAETAGPEGQAA